MPLKMCEYSWKTYLPTKGSILKTNIFPKKIDPFKWDVISKDDDESGHFILRSRSAPIGKIIVQYSVALKSFDSDSRRPYKQVFKDNFEFDNDNDAICDTRVIFQHVVINDYKKLLCATFANDIELKINIKAHTQNLQQSLENVFHTSDSNCSSLSNNMYGENLLSSILTDVEFCDAVLKVNDIEIKVHKNILAAASPFFRAAFTADMQEKKSNSISIKDIDIDSAKLMVSYIYKGYIELVNHHTAIKLLKASDIYDIQNLRQFCVDYLKINLNKTDVIDILLAAEVTNSAALKQAALEYLIKNPKMYKASDFQEILKVRSDILPVLLETVFKAYVECKDKDF